MLVKIMAVSILSQRMIRKNARPDLMPGGTGFSADKRFRSSKLMLHKIAARWREP
jgi:hypothetical protein